MMIGAAVLFFGLVLSIALHELGHLVVAKRVGARVSEFMVGFGPSLFAFRLGHTRYGLKLLPFGGYVRIIGMRAPDPSSMPTPETDHEHAVPGRDFYQLSTPRRVATMLAGPFANLVFAGVLLVFVLSVLGVPSATTSVGSVRACTAESCTTGLAASPAQAAGFLPGDKIVAIDAHAVESWEDISRAIAATSPGLEMVVEVRRAGKPVTLRPVVVANPQNPDTGYLGVTPQVALEQQTPGRVPTLLWTQAVQVVHALSDFPVRVAQTFDGAMRGEPRRTDDLVGIVGVGRLGADIGAADASLAVRLGQILVLLAGLNVSLAVFNLIPLLPLDGGHIALAMFESLRSRMARLRRRPDPGPVDPRLLLLVTQLVVVFFVTSSLLLLFADLVNPVQLP